MSSTRVTLQTPSGIGSAASFGVEELRRALTAQGYLITDRHPECQIIVTQGAASLPAGPQEPAARPESYIISKLPPCGVAVAGRDEKGMMYGCLDLAEQIEMGRAPAFIIERNASPELAVRGLYRFLFNEQAERDWVNAPAFWQGYADELARCRYNRFNLIYGHQSPYLIPIYAFMLDELEKDFPQIQVKDITQAERARNLQALQLASSAMASRGLTFFLGIWNSRPWTVANGVWETQPTRVTGADDLGLLVMYTRRGFTRLMELCPDITGIQLRMNIESGIADQRFFVQTFVPALNDLAAHGRRMVIELRNWGLHPDTIEAFRSTGLDIVVSTKYFAEHQGMPYQPPVTRGSYSYDSFLRKDKPFPFQWHVWNLGTHRLFAWGDPNYARRFAESCHLGDGVGFEVTPPSAQKGFSQWVQVYPGDWRPRTDLPAEWDWQRYWFFHWAFGRLGYTTKTGDDVFLHQLARRASHSAAPTFLAAYRAASQVISYLISQRMDDPNMYVWPELDAGGPIDHNTIAPPGEQTLFATAREYAQAVLVGKTNAKRSPFDAADDLLRLAAEIELRLATLATIAEIQDTHEYKLIRVDFAALAALARYHAAKSRAAGNLALFYVSGDRNYLDLAESEAREGVRLWERLCELTENYHTKLHFGPSGGHWRDNRPRVAYDLKRVQRVREIFDAYGLFAYGFDFGPGPTRWNQARFDSGLEPEPRFMAVSEMTAYTPEQGYGWLQPAGIRAFGMGDIHREIIWGVHYIRPGVEYDPAISDGMPLDGLTNRYLSCDTPRVFRVDAPDGAYRITLIAPAALNAGVQVQVGEATAKLGHTTLAVAHLDGVALDGRLDITIGGKGPWTLAGLIVTPRAPRIAHVPPVAALPGKDLRVTATATAPDGIASIVLRCEIPASGREIAMHGDGAAFTATIPAAWLMGERLDYEIVAVDQAGHVSCTRRCVVPVAHSHHAPVISAASGPATWARGGKITFALTLANGEQTREVILHYREADQNRNFRTMNLTAARSGEYVCEVDTLPLDDNYELIYYFEVLDVLGRGSFYPDPFTDARYRICKPV